MTFKSLHVGPFSKWVVIFRFPSADRNVSVEFGTHKVILIEKTRILIVELNYADASVLPSGLKAQDKTASVNICVVSLRKIQHSEKEWYKYT